MAQGAVTPAGTPLAKKAKRRAHRFHYAQGHALHIAGF